MGTRKRPEPGPCTPGRSMAGLGLSADRPLCNIDVGQAVKQAFQPAAAGGAAQRQTTGLAGGAEEGAALLGNGGGL